MVIALPARNQPAAAAHAQPLAGSNVDFESCLGKTKQEPVSCCNQACAAQRFLSLPPAWRPPQRQQSPPAAGRAHIRHRRLLRTRHPPLARPPRTSPLRVRRHQRRAQHRPGSPPHHGRRHQRTAPRHSKLRGLPAAPHPPPARERAHEQAQDMGRRIERSSLRRQRNAREVPILPSLRRTSVRHVSLRSPRKRRPHSHRQRPPESRRARGARPNPARLCSRQT
jgi:hypothetical protein